jgi:hypothetical protein
MVARVRGRQAAAASAWLSAFLLVVGCATTPLGEPGADCNENSDCTSASCATFKGFTWDAHVCSDPCNEVGSSCGGNGICRENLQCGPACEQKTRDALCRAGVLVPCLDLGAAEACLECGCDVFGAPPRSSWSRCCRSLRQANPPAAAPNKRIRPRVSRAQGSVFSRSRVELPCCFAALETRGRYRAALPGRDREG